MFPSTMPPRATQIPQSVAVLVNTIQAGKHKHQAPNKQQLKQLLDEFFDADNQISSIASSAGYADNGTPLKLIEVVTSLGVSVLLEDDPFSPAEGSFTEATNSLFLIRRVILQTPLVLLATVETQDSLSARSMAPLPPLYFWLAVRLLPVLACSHTSEIVPHVIQTLQCILATLFAMPEGWSSCQTLLKYCIASLESLTSSYKTRHESAGKFRVKLPGESFVASVQLPYADAVQFTVRETDGAILLAGRIFSILTICLAPKKDVPQVGWQDGIYSVLFESIAEIWRSVKAHSWNSSNSSSILTFKQELIKVILETLDVLITGRIVNFALRITIDTLSLPADEINQSLESPLSHILLQLLHLSNTNPSLSQALLLRVRPLIASHTTKKSWELFQKDFQLALVLFLYYISPDNRPRAQELLTAYEAENGSQWQFREKELEERADRLEQAQLRIEEDVHMDDGEGARKRRKISRSGDADGGGLKRLVRELYSTLGDLEAEDMAGLTSVASIKFKSIDEDAKCKSMKLLGIIACTSSTQTVDSPSLPSPSDLSDWGPFRCTYCDASGPTPKTRLLADPSISTESFSTLDSLFSTPEFQSSVKVRTWAMMSLRRLLNHSNNEAQLNIASSGLGKWVLQSLRSTRRELRIAAGRTLPCYIVGDGRVEDHDVLVRNRHIVMDFMRVYAESEDPCFYESCLMAYAEIVRVSERVELELSLLRLINYLGHSNATIMGQAYNIIESLPTQLSMSLRRIILPFLRTIGVSVVQQLQSRPQIAQHLADLLGKSVDDILVWTEGYTMPYMVLMKKKEIIERIARAHGEGLSTGGLITKLTNLPAIMSLLLTQPYEDVEGTAMGALRAVSEDFGNVTLAELLRSHEIGIAAELLKSYDTSPTEDRSGLVLRGIRILATHCVRRGTKLKDAELLPLFFEQNALGIMAQFSEEIHDVRGKQSITEKARILKGIEAMLIYAKSAVANALPQVCASLQSALETESLRSKAVDAWAAIFTALPESEVVSLLVQTISLIMQYWEDFDEETRGKCFELVGSLFEKYAVKIEENAGVIPSLGGVELFAKYQARVQGFKARLTLQDLFREILKRCKNENGAVVDQALKELEEALEEHSQFIHSSALSEQPDQIIADILRCLLDSASEHRNSNNPKTQRLLARCLGLVGAVDPARIDIAKKEHDVFVLQNFTMAAESVKFITYFLEEKLVKAFLSATDTKAQGFLAYTMQELLKFCGFSHGQGSSLRAKPDRPVTWDSLSTTARNALMPFLTSKYVLGGEAVHTTTIYPIFTQRKHTHRSWLQTFILDLLNKASGEQAQRLFNVCSKVIKGQDIGIALFLLPYIVLNIIVGAEDVEVENKISEELMTVLTYDNEDADPVVRDTVKHCSETVFMLVDRLSRWVEEKRKFNAQEQAQQARQANRHITTDDEDAADLAVQRVEKFLSRLPVDVMGLRSFECNAYARALFYWEQHIRNVRKKTKEAELEPLYQKLQHIYAQIDEPDGIEGISTNLHYFTMQQQIVEHTKAGRWGPVQIWYEKKLHDTPNDMEAQRNLLMSLKETGQYENIMLQVENYLQQFPSSGLEHIPLAVEAAWSSENWAKLDYYLSKAEVQRESYELLVGRALSALRRQDIEAVKSAIAMAQEDQIKKLSPSVTGSIRQCRDILLRLQMLSEVEVITTGLSKGASASTDTKLRSDFYAMMQRRLDILGSSSAKDKQELLATRRAVFQLSGIPNVNVRDAVAHMWLVSGRLARKSGQLRQAFDAVISAEKLGSPLATIEHCKLLWHEGNHRKAIKCLEGALGAKILANTKPDIIMHEAHDESLMETTNGGGDEPQNFLVAKASLMHAKWLDNAGQSHSSVIVEMYQKASKSYLRWEQGHYYLGRHYNKLYETEKALPLDRRSERFVDGSYTRLVCQCYLRAAAFGTKYIYQTIPRFLTLWLDFGELMKKPGDQIEGQEAYKAHIVRSRKYTLQTLHGSVKKYTDRFPAFNFFIAYSQILSRITHAQETVYEHLQRIITRIVSSYPKQALWALLAVCKSTQKDRSQRGNKILQQVRDGTHATSKKEKADLRGLINAAQRMNSDLLQLANFEIVGKQASMSLSRDIFRSSVFTTTPCPLVIPAQAVLSVSLPQDVNPTSHFNPFPATQPSIAGVQDEIDIMSSLQKPRKITVRGSDGKLYPFLVKPKDDLRKDARLMEFNSMINRLLKKDPESSLRSLHIRTYHVTPLNEECGLIEWVNNMRPLRDIIFKAYKTKNTSVNYNEIRGLLDAACESDDKTYIFTDVVLPKFPPVFHEWFVSKFPEPGAWFAARLAYARTAAVMSMVGHVLGLGDRHGENILFDETNGEALHVDFNCLFDKGQTFDKPERVPFRLTQNMVDALGVTGYEGPFRRSCEVSTRVLRTYEETLMTVLETFLHDPAVDMIKRKKSGEKRVDTPKDVLDECRRKLQGRFTGESVPLSVEGQVQELIRMAVCPKNLCAMYIGWMSFF